MRLFRAPLLRALLGGIAVATAISQPAAAQDAFPSRPISMIVPFAPGSTTDLIGRDIARLMTLRMGQQILVVPRPGAGGMIGTASVARAAPDGYTILFHSSGVTADQTLHPDANFDVMRDLAPITDGMYATLGIHVTRALPVTTLPELLAYARSHPGKINYGTSGIGGAMHLHAEAFRFAAGIDVVHVPYGGGAPALQAALSNEIQLLIIDPAATRAQVESGALRLLALGRTERSPLLPTVPSTAEAGLVGYEARVWWSFFAPGGTPKPIVERLYREISGILKEAEMASALTAKGYELGGNPPEVFAQQVAAEVAKWRDVVARAGIKQQ